MRGAGERRAGGPDERGHPERFKGPDGDWKEDVQWHAVVTWGLTAERASQLLKKGSKVALEGRLVHRSY